MKKVAIVCDSVCSLPPEIIEKYDIYVVPMVIVYEGKSYRDGIDITPNKVYKIMRKRGKSADHFNGIGGRLLECLPEVK